MAVFDELYPSNEENDILTRKRAAEILAQKGREGQIISDRGNVPLFTNIPQESSDVTTEPTRIDVNRMGITTPVDVPGGTFRNEVVYVPQEVMTSYAGNVPKKPSETEMNLLEKVIQARDHVKKNILKYDPEQIEPGRDALSAAQSYIKQNPKDKAGADKVYQATFSDAASKRAMGETLLNHASDIVKQEELKKEAALQEQKRHERNLAEKKAESGYIEPLKSNLPPAAPGEKQDAAIADLQVGQQNVVKKLTDYQIPLPSGMALRTPYWQGILERAASYDPSFDVSQYNVRMSLRRDFNSGKSAQNIRSLNTAIGHLDTLAEKAKALDNAPVQVWNWIANRGLTAAGDKRVTGFLNAATAVESELAAVFKGMGATDQEIKQWRSNLSDAQSPAQLKESINTAIELLGSRLGALQSQYETGMGKPKDFKFLSNKSESILKKLGVDTTTLDTVSGTTQQNNRADMNQVVETRIGRNGKKLFKLRDGSIVSE